MQRTFLLALFLASLASLAVSQKLAVRWAKTWPSEFSMAANPRGGIAILERTQVTALKSTGEFSWQNANTFAKSGAYDSNGHLFTAGIETHYVGNSRDNWLNLTRYAVAGSVLFAIRPYVGSAENHGAIVTLDELDRPYVFQQVVFDSELNPNPTSGVSAYSATLQFRYGTGGSLWTGTKASVDAEDNAIINVGINLKKVSPSGSVLWDYTNGYPWPNLLFVRFDNALIFASGFSYGEPCQIINSAGISVGAWGPAGAPFKYESSSFVATTARPGPGNALLKFDDTGRQLWRRSLGDGTASTSIVRVIGTDRWVTFTLSFTTG